MKSRRLVIWAYVVSPRRVQTVGCNRELLCQIFSSDESVSSATICRVGNVDGRLSVEV